MGHHNAVEAVHGPSLVHPSYLVEVAPAPWACHAEAVQAEVQAVLNEASLTHGQVALCLLHMAGQGHAAERSRAPVAARALADKRLLPGHCRASVGTCLLAVAPWHAGLGGRHGCMDLGVVVLHRVGQDPHTSWTCKHHVPLRQTWRNSWGDAPLKAVAQPLVPSLA